MSTLHLLPSPLSQNAIDTIPARTIDTIHSLSYFITERAKTSRRFISATNPPYAISELNIFEMDKHDESAIRDELVDLFKNKKDVGLLSEAGSPCVADPGAWIVDLARDQGYTIIPHSGPNSIIQALMASGMNGQQFVFHGYPPVKMPELKRKLQQVVESAQKTGYTHIFIETPYRNKRFLEAILHSANKGLRLAMASDLTGEKEQINVANFKQWQSRITKMHFEKIPAIFLIGK